MCFSEASSKYPFSGGIYIWTGKLGTEELAPITAFFSGYLICIGTIMNISTNSIASSQLLNSIIKVIFKLLF